MTHALVASHLTKSFGGLTAVNDVSLSIDFGTIHAVIGPNGAGKSTLTNLLSGDLLPTSGSIEFGDDDLTRLSPAQRSRKGVGRSYQRTNVFGSLSAFENCRLAVQSRYPTGQHLWLEGSAPEQVRRAAIETLGRVGLSHRVDSIAGTLSHGEQRLLEIAVVLATRPNVLLLDEPLAGTGAAEARRLVDLLQQLRSSHAILLIEHDMDAVFTLAQQLTVMVDGRVIASGEPERVRADPEVQRAYLGSETRAAA